MLWVGAASRHHHASNFQLLALQNAKRGVPGQRNQSWLGNSWFGRKSKEFDTRKISRPYVDTWISVRDGRPSFPECSLGME